MAMAEPGRETAFSMRWNALKTKAENATKELAANIQEQRDKYMENRARSLAEKSASLHAQTQPSTIDDEQHEEALRIVQYQNKALRDRLRSTAAENERLHEMLKEYRQRKEEDESADRAPVSSTVPQLEQQIKLLRENVATAEEVAAKKEAHHKQEVARMKAEVEAVRGELESTLAMETAHRTRLDALTKEKEALETALETERVERASSAELCAENDVREVEADDAREELKAGLAQLKEQVGQRDIELHDLRAAVRSLTEERDTMRGAIEKHESQATASLLKTQKEVELLQALLDSAKTAEREANEEVRRHSSLNSEIKAEVGVLQERIDALTAERDTLRERFEEIQAGMISAKNGASEAVAAHAESVDKLEQELASMRAQQAEASRLLEEKTVALDDKTAALDQALADASDTASVLAEHVSKEAIWVGDRMQLEQRVAELQRQLEEHESKDMERAASTSQVDDLKARLAEQAARIAEHTAEKAALEQRLLHVEQQLKLADQASASHAASAVQNNAEVELLKSKLAEAENANRDAMEHKRLTAEKLDELQSMISSGAKAVDEVRRLQSLLAEKDAEIHRLVEAAQLANTKPSSPAPPSYDAVMNADDLKNKIERLERELAERERSQKRSDEGVDVEYLAAVLRQSFACGELDARSPIFGVIARLLHFTDTEIENVITQADKKKDEATSMLPDLTSMSNMLPDLSKSFSR